MPSFQLTINNQKHEIQVEGDMPLLWALRDVLGLTGTKFGCGIAQCGACTVLLDQRAVRSCSVPVNSCEDLSILTIEGVEESQFRVLQEAWIQEQVPQCGYCQSGQIMNAIGLLKRNSEPSDEEIRSAMAGNICRCGTYPRILKAITSVVQSSSLKDKT